ncbi:MAG: NAD-dependent epimerase/dehydratase family protein [Gemmatimonadota bacterium]
MRILVTGGTGFTGAALVHRLVELGHDVVSLDYQAGRREDELRAMGAELVRGSVTDPDAVGRCMEGVEVVHHVAAAFRELDVSRRHYDEVNVGGARVVLDAAVRHGVRRFVNCSTCGVHGNVEHPPAGEDAPIAPADYYQRTKYRAEPLVSEYSERHGLSAVTLRPAAIYGPGDPERFFMIFRRVAGGTFPMFGSGRTLYHPLYIDNLVDAFLLAQDSDISGGRPYLIADEDYYQIEQIVEKVGSALDVDVKIPHYPVAPLVAAGYVCEAVCKPFGIAPPIFPRRVDWFRQNRAFDITRAKTELGYTPAVGLDEGLRRTGEWYRSEGMLPPA